MAGWFAFQICFETLSGWWQDGSRSDFVETIEGRWRGNGGTVAGRFAFQLFFEALAGRRQDGFAFGIHACMRVKLYYSVMLYYVLYSCVCTVCEY